MERNHLCHAEKRHGVDSIQASADSVHVLLLPLSTILPFSAQLSLPIPWQFPPILSVFLYLCLFDNTAIMY
jgi:hypothetical protein